MKKIYSIVLVFLCLVTNYDVNAQSFTLFDQLTGNGLLLTAPSNHFANVANEPRLEVADEFIVPAGATWNIDSFECYVDVIGSPAGYQGYYVRFFDNVTGVPGALIDSQFYATTTLPVSGVFSMPFTNVVTLGAGTYSVSVTFIQDLTTANDLISVYGDYTGSDVLFIRDAVNFGGSGAFTWTAINMSIDRMSFALYGDTAAAVSICQADTLNFSDTICAGSLAIFPDGSQLNMSNDTMFSTSFVNVDGCDSTNNYALTVIPNAASTDVLEACDSLTWIDGNVYTSSNNTATHTVVSANGCDSIITLNLTITNTPTVSLSSNADMDSLFATSTASTYIWYKDGVEIVGETGNSLFVDADGAYTCEGSNGNCSSISNTIDVVLTGIQKLPFTNLSIHPNPTKGIIHISAQETIEVIRIYEVSGKLLQTYQDVNEVNLANLSNGLYLMELANKANRTVYKILKD